MTAGRRPHRRRHHQRHDGPGPDGRPARRRARPCRGDVSVIGMDNLVMTAYANPPLTSVAMPSADMARTMVAMVRRASCPTRIAGARSFVPAPAGRTPVRGRAAGRRRPRVKRAVPRKSRCMTTILLTHSPQALANYYGERALRALRELGDVRLNPGDGPGHAAGRHPPGARVPDRRIQPAGGRARGRCSRRCPTWSPIAAWPSTSRNIDVEAASRHGVLVTRATPGFDASVSEWIIGAMIDASRHISRAASAYWGGQAALIAMGRELRGATVGIIGHGHIGSYLARMCPALRLACAGPGSRQPQTLQEGMRQVGSGRAAGRVRLRGLAWRPHCRKPPT